MMEAIKSLRSRVMNSVARSIITALDDTGDIQVVKVNVLSDETLDEVERVQNYGFASSPKPGSQAVMLMVGGNRDHPLVIAADNPKTRKKSLKAGETAVYGDAVENFLYFKEDKKSELKTKELTLTLTDGFKINGGNIEIDIQKISIKNAAGDDLVDLVAQLADALTKLKQSAPFNAPVISAEALIIIPKLEAFKV